MIRHNDNVIPLPPSELALAMERHPAGKGRWLACCDQPGPLHADDCEAQR